MSVARLLAPKSIAIVGASDKVGPGFNAWNALKAVGFHGEVHLVNPSRDSLFGQPCYPSIDAVPANLDAVFVAVPFDRVLDVVKQSAAKGAAGLAILSSGFGEAGPEGTKVQADLVAFAAAHGIAVCGPNCLGFLNFAARTALFGTSLPASLPVGNVAAVVQSGSIGIALLNSGRGLGLSHLITTGNEAVTTAADYLEALIDDPAVRTVAVFLEQLRKPQQFIDVCRRAKSQRKSVVVLKSGRSAAGQQAVMAHTGAVAGEVAVCDAALREAGAIQVFSLDELIETTLAASILPATLKSHGVAMLSLSGGEIALALDAAEEARLRLPPISVSRDALTTALPAGFAIGNPLDLSWAGIYDPSIARRCVKALAQEPGVGVAVLLQDAPGGLGSQQANRYATLLGAVADGAANAGIPLVTVSNISGDPHPDYARMAETKAVGTLRGTWEGMSALARVLNWHAAEPMAASAIPPTDPARIAAAGAKLKAAGATRILNEYDAKAVLEAYGMPSLRERLVDTAQDAAAAVRAFGTRVVLKALVPDVAHKSELSLVRLDIDSPEKAAQVAEELLAKARALAKPGVTKLLVQEMVKPIAELLVGARVDPQFGPVIVVGGGGVNVELFKDVAIRLAPVTEATAVAMIRSTKTGRLLQGWRGARVGDVAAAAQAIAALSRFIADFRDDVSEVEINPLAVLEAGQGCRPLDCLIVRRETPAGSG
jgi:acetate---CoA ligase (ADP-forming)